MSEKIHPPTPRKRQQAKEQGRGPRSTAMVSSATLLAAALCLRWSGPALATGLMEALETALREPAVTLPGPLTATRQIGRLVWAAGGLLLPLLVTIGLAAVALQVAQTGWRPQLSRLQPQAERLSPLARLRTLGSARALGGFGITVLKLTAVTAIAGTLLRTQVGELLSARGQPLAATGARLFGGMVELCLWVGGALTVFAMVDFAWAWWQFERELRMTEQELREEMRDTQSASARTARSREVQGVS
jgi:flagellar biosynthetic protein FlhB